MEKEPFNNPFGKLKETGAGESKDEVKKSEAPRHDHREATKEKPIPPGEYKLMATFINKSGKEVSVELKRLDTSYALSIEEVERQISSWASSVGLHNYGMDVYIGKYPDGHPVRFSAVDAKDESVVHEFVQYRDGNGYPVKDKKND